MTVADREVEQYLVAQIRAAYPGHGIIGEELGSDGAGREFVWVLDPIDGTRAFVAGLPVWAVSLGLLRDGRPYRGVVFQPALNEWYFTDEAGDAFWGERPLAGRLATHWGRDSFLCTSADVHRRFRIDVGLVRALGSLVSDQCLVARGSAAAALLKRPSLWDLAAGQAILRAVDAVAVHLDGSSLNMDQVRRDGRTQSPVVVGHPAMVEYLLPRIQPLSS